MDISELDSIISKFKSDRLNLASVSGRIRDMEGEAKVQQGKRALLTELSEVTGEKYGESNPENGELGKIIAERANLEDSVKTLESKIDEGLEEIQVPVNISDVKSSGNDFVIPYKSGTHSDTISYLMEALGSGDEVVMDDTIFEFDKIIVRGASSQDEAIKMFIAAVKTLRMIGAAAQGKVHPDVEDVSQKLHKSSNRQIWEELADRGKSTPQLLAKKLELEGGKVTDALYNWARSGFKIMPISRDGQDNYSLTSGGKLVWQNYKKKFLSERNGIETAESSVMVKNERDERNERGKNSLNDFFEAVYLKDVN